MSETYGLALLANILPAPEMPISQVNSQALNVRAAMAINALRANASSISRASGVARQADSVELSDAARALSSASHAVGQASDVRSDKVAAIKASIADGTYAVDSRALAQSMVRAGIR